MWEQARKNDRQIKHLMNEHKKKFERRKDQIEKNRRKPCEFLHLYGVKAQIHLNSSLTSQAESCLIPWNGDGTNATTIDRFDARAHLDSLPSDTVPSTAEACKTNESHLNYLRFKDLIQCEFLDIPEEKRLEQEIFIPRPTNGSEDSDSDDESSNPINCNMSSERLHFLNAISQRYMIDRDDFVKHLREERRERQKMRLARKAENEKSILSSSKSKKDRNLPKDRKIHIDSEKSDTREIAPSREHSPTSSSSSSDEDSKINRKKEFIHSIGGSSDEEDTKRVKKDNRDRDRVPASGSGSHGDRRYRSSHRKRRSVSRSRSRSRSNERRRDRRRDYRDRSRDRERDRRYRSDRDAKNWRRSDREERHRDGECDIRLRNLRGKSRDEDEFGREKRKRATSPVVEKRKEVIKKVVDDTHEQVKTLPHSPPPPPPPPPTVKRYYRPELEKESDTSSHSSDDDSANAQSNVLVEMKSKVPSVPGFDHKGMLQQTRSLIECQYKREKQAAQAKSKMFL